MNTETLIVFAVILWIAAMASLCCLMTVIQVRKMEHREAEEETRYPDAIPGMTQSILDGAKEPFDTCIPEEQIDVQHGKERNIK